MNRFHAIRVPALLIGAVAAMYAGNGPNRSSVVLTASNTTTNQLLVYDTSGNLLQTVSTQGQGGVSGNAGGIATSDGLTAVVNFGSKSVSIFAREGNGFQVRQLISTASSPVSVAFGNGHLYVLGTTTVESHAINGGHVSGGADGVVALYKADGSAAQVGVVEGQLVITEKSNVIETVNLQASGAVSGAAALVQNIPANVDTPFGLVTRGNNAYVTIAHADETALVRNGAVLTVTPSGTQHSPCWAALVGPFLYLSNSPSKTVSRYAVYGQKIVSDAPVAAQLTGSPTDIASADHTVALVDGSGAVSRVSIYHVDEDGNLSMTGIATINSAANGVAVIE
jgi:hypothetical protein